MRGRSFCDDFCGDLFQAYMRWLVNWLGLGLALAGTVSCGCLVLWLRSGLANPNPNPSPNPNPDPNPNRNPVALTVALTLTKVTCCSFVLGFATGAAFGMHNALLVSRPVSSMFTCACACPCPYAHAQCATPQYVRHDDLLHYTHQGDVAGLRRATHAGELLPVVVGGVGARVRAGHVVKYSAEHDP